MRISDWSSDVCSSDLPERRRAVDQNVVVNLVQAGRCAGLPRIAGEIGGQRVRHAELAARHVDQFELRPGQIDLRRHERQDRKRVVSGTSESVRVAIGGRRTMRTKKTNTRRTKK